MTGAELIAKERQRQIEEEKHSAEQDVIYWTDKQLVRAAVCYALPPKDRMEYGLNKIPVYWPWGDKFWKPTPDDRVRELVKAGALIAAEIDRLQATQEPVS